MIKNQKSLIFITKIIVFLSFKIDLQNRLQKALEAAKLTSANKTKETITSQRLGSRNFWRVDNSLLSKVKSTIPPLLHGPELLSFASD